MTQASFYKTPGMVDGAPYSAAVRYGDLVWTCGQLGMDAEGNFPPSFEEQVNLAFDNLETALKTAGADLKRVIKISAFVLDINQLDAFNAVYRQRVNMTNPPVRTTVQIADFQDGIHVEIDAVAFATS